MFPRNLRHFSYPNNSDSFNMTPIIDIVFLLIIFFLVVCQFIEAENFPVTVPDNCSYAQDTPPNRPQPVTLTVVKTTKQNPDFAVGSEKVAASNPDELVKKLARLIDARLQNLPPQRRIVALRLDKNIPFGQAQYALAAVAASTAVNIRLAALKEPHPNPN